jgi:cytochrome c
MKKHVLFGLVAGVALMGGVSAASAQNAAEGEKVFRQCKACHSLEAGKKGVGPSLNGLIGRQSGSLADFAYSPAMKNAGVTWNEENLSKYIADPKGFVAGNKMAFAGVKKEEDLKNVVAYLLEAIK